MTHVYVYVIREAGLLAFWHHKIGVSNHPQRRLAQLQTGNPRKLVVARSIPFASEKAARTAELALHRSFRFLRGRGEWFVLFPFLLPVVVWMLHLNKRKQWWLS